MLTIKNFDVLKGRVFVMPNFQGYFVIEADSYISPVWNDSIYILKLKSAQNNKDITFSLYRDMNTKEDGYRLYNSISGDFSVIKLESLKDMRTFTDILKDELNSIC